MDTALLSVRNLTLKVADRIIVDHLSFDLRSGEIVALTGRSGSGKSSIALAILGLLPAAIRIVDGSIHWNNGNEITWSEHAAEWPDLRGKQIGYTQQDPFGGFDPVMRMGKQMMMAVRERTSSGSRVEEKDLRIRMEETGLTQIDRLWHSYPHQLSGGQLQRCQIAMAILTGPKLLIADEPTSAIDRINQTELLEVFRMLKTRYNMAILCITHDDSVVRQIADREINLEQHPNGSAKSTGEVLNTKKSGDISQVDNGQPILLASNIAFTHAYGGLFRHQGAEIGPIDFSLYRGTCLGLAGESGSGKSTLARILVGLHHPARGTVTVEDRQIDFLRQADLKFLRSRVQLVMQDGRGSLHPEITIGRLLEEVIELRQKHEHDFRCEPAQCLAEVGLPNSVLTRKSGQLSGGECLRVNIARALIPGPVVLICDESTSALDRNTRDGIVALLEDLMSLRQLAILCITHDELVLKHLSQRVMVMANGKIVEQGRTDEVIRYPTHDITRKIFAFQDRL